MNKTTTRPECPDCKCYADRPCSCARSCSSHPYGGTRKIRLSARVASFLDGGQLFQTPEDLALHGYGTAGQSFVAKCAAANHRKDGSCIVALTYDEAFVLARYAEAMLEGARDCTWDPDGVADLNASRSCLRNLAAEGVKP